MLSQEWAKGEVVSPFVVGIVIARPIPEQGDHEYQKNESHDGDDQANSPTVHGRRRRGWDSHHALDFRVEAPFLAFCEPLGEDGRRISGDDEEIAEVFWEGTEEVRSRMEEGHAKQAKLRREVPHSFSCPVGFSLVRRDVSRGVMCSQRQTIQLGSNEGIVQTAWTELREPTMIRPVRRIKMRRKGRKGGW